MNPHLGWNLGWDVSQLLTYPFMVNALQAATITAVVAGVAGWLMVLRRETFAGHTLSVVAFPGAAGAAWLGIPAAWGYFGLCLAAAAVIAATPAATSRRSSSDAPALVGTVQATALAFGLLFVSLAHSFLSGVDGLLFGTFLGVTTDQVLVLLVMAAGSLLLLGVLGRPLLFASVDPVVATARGVPVRLVGGAYLVVLAATVAAISQITGALLVFALLVMPAAAALRITSRPVAGILLSVLLGVATAWLGLALSYFYDGYPSGFWITTVGFGLYLLAGLRPPLPALLRRRPCLPPGPPRTPRGRPTAALGGRSRS